MDIKYNTETLEEFDDAKKRLENSTIICECGCDKLYVNWISAPYTGGYLKVTCPKCGKFEEILDDYA